MKHQYFGDQSDYIKYGLLRCFAEQGLKIGVCWMLTPDDGTNDGKKTTYLRQPKLWARHDIALFDHLAALLAGPDGRNLRRIESGPWIPGARFHSTEMPSATADRDEWYRQGLAALKGADLLFFDPDNGLEVPSQPRGGRNSAKYLYWNELVTAWDAARAVVVFQHFTREDRQGYVRKRVDEMRARLDGANVVALASANVLFLLAHRTADAQPIESALSLVRSRWGSRIRWDSDSTDHPATPRRAEKRDSSTGGHVATEAPRARAVRRDDFAAWRALWDGYNAFYGRAGATALPEEVTQTTWQRFFDPAELVHALVAELDSNIVGLAHYLFHRSTTRIEAVCYLQDLFTARATRQRGVGHALIREVYARALAAGARRVYWQTKADNAPARALYDKLAQHAGFIVYAHEPTAER